MTSIERPVEILPVAQTVGPLASPAAPAAPATRRPDERLRLYVWEIPVRVSHWITVFAILVLALSGGYIADPFLIPPDGSIMRVVRFAHMLAAFVFVGSGLLRAYWLFAGNRFARWRAFLPVSGLQRRELARQIGWYLFVRRDAPRVLGHNALAAGTYTVVFFLFLVQTVTGFALAGMHGTEPWATLFGWVPSLLGGVSGMRLIHHLVMWVIVAFMIHHVYSAILVDHWERNGLLSSIFSGYKFVTRREIEEARDGGPAVEERAE